MGLKKYIIGGLLLTIAIFGYAFSIEAGDYKVQVLDFKLILPIAVWVVLPMITLLVLTILHMMYYSIKNYFMVKAITKDSNSLISLINNRLLNKSSDITFQNENFKEIGEVITQLDIDVTNKNFSSLNKDIAKTVNQKLDILSGNYIPSKELKLEQDNPLMTENTKNRISEDDNYALEIVKSPSKNSQEILKFAFFKVIEVKSMTTIKKIVSDLHLDNDMLKALFKKDSEQKPEFAMPSDLILSLMKKAELSNDELILIARDYKKSMAPDQLIKLFEDLCSENDAYTTVYLYVLAEYEMIDNIRDILINSATNDFIAFKALLDLKDAGKHTYSLDSISYK